MKVMLVFDAVILLFGIYMVISSLQMKKSGRINAMVIAEEEMKKCKDTAGFVSSLMIPISPTSATIPPNTASLQ